MVAVASHAGERANACQRRRPETTALYEVVRDNLELCLAASSAGCSETHATSADTTEKDGQSSIEPDSISLVVGADDARIVANTQFHQ